MRRRLMTLVLASTLLALGLLGVILISVIWALMGSTTLDRAAATARVAASGLEESCEAGAVITETDLAAFLRDDASLEATLPDGTVLVAGDAVVGDSYSATSVAGEVSVTARIPTSVNVARITDQALLVVAISCVALMLAMVVAHFYARRITRPLEDFAAMAERIATGDRRMLAQRYGVRELDAVADVLDRAITNFNLLLESERQVTTDASHQLRTPLTALSLRLEEILATDDLDVVRVEATAALGQVERLSGVVDEVVDASRGRQVSPVRRFGVDELVAGQLVEWRPAFEAASRRLRRVGGRGLSVQGAPGSLAQALATLIENSLAHGEGSTVVQVRESGSWVVIEVSDEGPGVPVGLAGRVFERSVSGAESSGVGLALARTLVVTQGGRLEMLSARPAVFAMFLPAAPAARVDATTQAVVATAASSAASTSSGNTQRR